jgi:hypothetical protein
MDIKQFAYELGFENHEKATPLKLFRWICMEDKINIRNDLAEHLGKNLKVLITEKLEEYEDDGTMTIPSSWKVKKLVKKPKKDMRIKKGKHKVA